MMRKFPPDDDKLVAFIREYRPMPPPSSVNLEQQLIGMVKKTPICEQQSDKRRWLISGACMVSLLLFWVGWRWSAPQPQVAVTTEELETFLVESWQTTFVDSMSPLQYVNNGSELDWTVLGDLSTQQTSTPAVYTP